MDTTEIRQGDASEINSFGDSIDLTVTSPPYLDAIDYEQHAESGFEKDFRSTNTEDSDIERYFGKMEEAFQSVYDGTNDGGYCAVVIGSVKTNDGEWYPLPHQFASMMMEMGWNFHETITWNKVTGGSSRFGVTIQHPYPGYYYPNQQKEEIQIWRRGEISRSKNEDSKLDVTTDQMKKEIANNVWHVAPVPPGKEDHPCPFPEEIAHRLISLYSNVGDVVADPFIGSGTTAKAARNLNRQVKGVDVLQKYVEESRLRSREVLDRRDQIVPSFDTKAPTQISAELSFDG